MSSGSQLAVPYQKRDTFPMQTSAIESAPSFRQILLATDFSPASRAAFQAALETCSKFGADLLVLHIFEYAEIAPPETGGLLLEMQGIRERCQKDLEDLCHEASSAGIQCESLLQNGSAPSRILEIIKEKHIDLAVLGTNALHGFERLIFGSTAETVLRKASCPVLTVGPRVARSPKDSDTKGPIVFATDFDFTTMSAIRQAAYVAGVAGAPLHCLHVLPRTFEDGSQCEIVPAIMSEALHQLANESGITIQPPTCATTFGSEVSYAVVDYARQHNAQLIVLGVRQASLLASHVPEHITYRIITEASCPVLTMAFSSHSLAVHSAAPREPKHAPARHVAM